MPEAPQAPPAPSVGDQICIPTALYIEHGRDDFSGGLCSVSAVKRGISGGAPTDFVEVCERPGVLYNWPHLARRQEELRTLYGNRRGRPDPDLSEASNPAPGW